MSLGTILLIVIVIALLGGFSGLGGPFYGTGYNLRCNSMQLEETRLHRHEQHCAEMH